MNPNDMQALQQAYQQAGDVAIHFKFLVYSTYAAIIICATFSILIFWKLRGIANEFMKFRIAYEMAEGRKARAAKPTPHRTDDQSRCMPKS